MSTLSSLLTRKQFLGHEDPFVNVDPATRYAIFAGSQGPERVDSAYRRVLVPLFDWPQLGKNEDDEIIRVFVEAAATNPLKLPHPSKVDDIFWVKNRRWAGLLFNPSLTGKFLIPDDILVFTSNLVPGDTIVLIGQPEAAGTYAVKGDSAGVITNKREGLLQIQFLTV